MPELPSAADHGDIDQKRRHSRFLSFLPYLLILIFTLVGVAYTSINKKPLILYWEILAVFTGVLCVVGGWRHTQSRADRVRLIWTQALHWAAFLATMNLLLISDVQRMLNADATGLAVLLLLALGTFVAGVHSLSWQTCTLGVVMALAVPAIAWIEESALVLLLSAIALIGLSSLFWWFGSRRTPAVELEGA
ncbi:MAG TPA: hypothetical protein VNR65_03065 [Geobacterales bacterium]|nr:hypothetical protein [Geobacterales bacterium]